MIRKRLQREVPHLRLITACRLQTARNKRTLQALPWLRMDGTAAPDFPPPPIKYVPTPYTGIKYWYYVTDRNSGTLVSYIGRDKTIMTLCLRAIRKAHPHRLFDRIRLEQCAESCVIIGWLPVERLDDHLDLSVVPEYSK